MVSYFHLLHPSQSQRRRRRQHRLHTDLRSRGTKSSCSNHNSSLINSLPNEPFPNPTSAHTSSIPDDLIPNNNSTHISSLPSELFSQILSYLDSKSAVAICILSRNWINFPESLRTVVLDDAQKSSLRSYWDYNLEFQMYRLRQIILRKHIDKLSLRSHFAFDSVILSIIRAAIWRQAREIEIWLDANASTGRLPSELYTLRSLEVLKLTGPMWLGFPHLISLPNLKVFELKDVNLPDTDTMRQLLEGCLSLEELLVSGKLEHIELFDISIPTLKKFTFITYDDDMSETTLSIDAPELEIFIYLGSSVRFNLVKKLKFLARAELNIAENVQDPENLSSFIDGLSGVKSLFLSATALKLAFPSPLDSVLECVTFLEVTVYGLQIVPSLLALAPLLEELVIHSYSSDNAATDADPYHWPDTIPMCLEEHIRRIVFHFLDNVPDGFEFIKYCLLHGKVLEVMAFSGISRKSPNIPKFEEIVTEFTNFSECEFEYNYSSSVESEDEIEYSSVESEDEIEDEMDV